MSDRLLPVESEARADPYPRTGDFPWPKLHYKQVEWCDRNPNICLFPCRIEDRRGRNYVRRCGHCIPCCYHQEARGSAPPKP